MEKTKRNFLVIELCIDRVPPYSMVMMPWSLHEENHWAWQPVGKKMTDLGGMVSTTSLSQEVLKVRFLNIFSQGNDINFINSEIPFLGKLEIV
mmetsp:Transcript_24576/g.68824  ORF Transcript_24576/g.68824 Transcript_24576/m.68824 type:complete len:93 (-) Transcript_24576:2528-2806(-)